MQVSNFSDQTKEELLLLLEEYPELKGSLQRYEDDPNMKKYTVNELKEKRSANKKIASLN
jgi:hypothetical protein